MQIIASKQPRRPHYIEEWCRQRGLKQIELAREIGADRGLVSRWFDGASPSVDWQSRLARFFFCEPVDLFCHPDEAWMRTFLSGRSDAELRRIKAVLEIAFPKKDA